MKQTLIAGTILILLLTLTGAGWSQCTVSITNPQYDSTIAGWSVAKYTGGLSGLVDWNYATSGLSIAGPRSAPGMAKSEWSGHNQSQHCSIYQTITGTAGQAYTITVYGQCVTSEQTSTLQLRAADGTNTWTTATPPGTVIGSIPSVGGGDNWRLVSGVFTPSSNTFQIGLTWMAGGSGAPWAIVVAAADDWTIDCGGEVPTNTPVPPTNTPVNTATRTNTVAPTGTPTGAHAVVFISPTNGSFTPGANFSLEVRLNSNGLTNIAGVNAFVQFDQSLMSFTDGLTNTAIWNNSTLTANPREQEPGIISFPAYANASVTGSDVLVATLNFQAAASPGGPGMVNFMNQTPRLTDVTDANFNSLTAVLQGASVQVSSGPTSTPVDTPTQTPDVPPAVVGSRTVGCYTAGQNLTVSVQIAYQSSLTSLSMTEALPAGWTYVSVGGANPPAGAVQSGNELQMLWFSIPSTGPLNFTYTVTVPGGTTGNQTLAGTIFYTIGTGDLTQGAIDNSVVIPCGGDTPTNTPVPATDTPVPPTNTPVDTPTNAPTIAPVVVGSRTVDCYTAGQNLTVGVQITYPGNLTSLSMTETLPAGWTYVSVGGANPPAGAVQSGNELQMLWFTIPPTGPLSFTYTVTVPGGTTGNQTLAGTIFYTIGTGDLTQGAIDNTVVIPCGADTPTPTQAPATNTPAPPTTTPTATLPCSTFLPGDINRDCFVDSQDLILLMQDWKMSSIPQ